MSVSVRAPLTDNAGDWIQHGGLCSDSADAPSLDSACSERVTESQTQGRGESVCIFVCAVCVCVCLCHSVGVSQTASHGPLCALGFSLPAGRARCLVAPLPAPLALPLLLPFRAAQSTATCYRINISSRRGQRVIPPLMGQSTLLGCIKRVWEKLFYQNVPFLFPAHKTCALMTQNVQHLNASNKRNSESNRIFILCKKCQFQAFKVCVSHLLF